VNFYFTQTYPLAFIETQHIRMINEELLRENGNLKDLVVQTSAGLEREKSSQEKLIHHNKLINSDNATLQTRVEELLSVIDRQRRELAAAYESSQRMAFEQSVAWREV
jgi:RNA polymerase-binding transcription factor DksA